MRPLLSRTRPAFCDRSLQGRVQREHVVRAPFDIGVAEHQPAEHSEVVLEVVYRIRRICRRRPCEARPGFLRRRELERLMIWNPPGDRAHDLERVKRRHARSGFGRFDAWEGRIQPVCRSADRETQEKPLDLRAIAHLCQGYGGQALQREVFVEVLPQIVEQQRILTQLLRKHPLCQAGREHDLEHAAPGLMRAADEDASVSIRRRLHFERQQSSREDITDFE